MQPYSSHDLSEADAHLLKAELVSAAGFRDIAQRQRENIRSVSGPVFKSNGQIGRGFHRVLKVLMEDASCHAWNPGRRGNGQPQLFKGLDPDEGAGMRGPHPHLDAA